MLFIQILILGYLFTVLSCQIEIAKIALLLQIAFTQVSGEVLEK